MSMKFGTPTFLTAVVLLGLQPIPARSASSGITTFDAPGAIRVAGSFDGTFPSSINNAGTITGIYVDANTLYHGFLRSPGGEFTSLDAPGAGTSVGTRFRMFPAPTVNIKTRSININDRGAVTGNYIDSDNVSHGFLRSPAGEFITLDAPGARSAAGSFDGTFPSSINNGGTITGNFIDSKDLNHGFLRSPSGAFITFDAPGVKSVAAAGYGTVPESINDSGAITGHYIDVRDATRGFMRAPGGSFTSFDAPGASSTAAFGYGTVPESINDAGAVTGHYGDASGVFHGFLRAADGKITTFDAPGAATGTLPKSINAGGAITGHYVDAQNVDHGFVRSPSGNFTTFDVPGAGTDAGSGFGTFPDSINDAGAITGHYIDAQGLNHGFLLIP
jgi:hypothetical protein